MIPGKVIRKGPYAQRRLRRWGCCIAISAKIEHLVRKEPLK